MRLSAMGDVAMTVPVIAALRRAYPELRISILTRRGFRPFFRDIPDLSFVDFDPTGRHKGFSDWYASPERYAPPESIPSPTCTTCSGQRSSGRSPASRVSVRR